jgi:DNA-binding transcriptional ArsR family regulator
MDTQGKNGGFVEPDIILHSIADVLSWPDPKWLIDSILTEASFSVLYGPPGVGKSFIALGWAHAIAANTSWLDWEVNGGGCVVYIAAEGVGGLKKRIRALQDYEGYSPDLPVFFINKPVNFLESGDVQGLIEAWEAKGVKPSLVVVDTLARCFVGGEENSAKDMGQFNHGVESIRRDTGAAVAVVHHTGKDPSHGARGSSALLAAADTMIEVVDQGMGVVNLKCVKQKEAEEFSTICMERKTIDLGDGQSSCIMSPFDPAQIMKSPKDSVKAKKMLAKLAEEFGEEGATHGEWKKAFVDGLGMSESTFNRQLRELQAGGLVEKTGDGQGVKYRLVKAEPDPE